MFCGLFPADKLNQTWANDVTSFPLGGIIFMISFVEGSGLPLGLLNHGLLLQT